MQVPAHAGVAEEDFERILQFVHERSVYLAGQAKEVPHEVFFGSKGTKVKLPACKVLNRLRPYEPGSGPAPFPKSREKILGTPGTGQLTMEQPATGEAPPHDRPARHRLTP